MRLAPIIMILIILQGVIIMYDQVYPTGGCTGDVCTGEYELISYGDNKSALWNFAANPTDWRGTDFLVFFFAILAASAVATFVGAVVGYKGDMILFFGTFTFFLALGSVPILSLYNVITRESGFFGCTTGVCYPAIFMWVFTGGILAMFYVLAVLDWWRTGSTG